MKAIIRARTELTPGVNFDPDKGLISLIGRSIPEHTVEFYRLLKEWIEEYVKNPQPKTTVEIHLDYFNTASTKQIVDILRRMEKFHNAGHDTVVNWYYEEDDEDIFETGEDFASFLKIPFNVILTHDQV